jgi:hypothetical protein
VTGKNILIVMVKFIPFHVIENLSLEIFIPFLFGSLEKLNKGISKIFKQNIHVISHTPLHIHTSPYVGGNCEEFFISMHVI